MFQRGFEMIELALEEFDFIVTHPGVHFLQCRQTCDLVPQQITPTGSGIGNQTGYPGIGDQFGRLQHLR